MKPFEQLCERHPIGAGALGVLASFFGVFLENLQAINSVLTFLGSLLGIAIGIITIVNQLRTMRDRDRDKSKTSDDESGPKPKPPSLLILAAFFLLLAGCSSTPAPVARKSVVAPPDSVHVARTVTRTRASVSNATAGIDAIQTAAASAQIQATALHESGISGAQVELTETLLGTLAEIRLRASETEVQLREAQASLQESEIALAALQARITASESEKSSILQDHNTAVAAVAETRHALTIKETQLRSAQKWIKLLAVALLTVLCASAAVVKFKLLPL